MYVLIHASLIQTPHLHRYNNESFKKINIIVKETLHLKSLFIY